MATKIRLARGGTKKRPFYSIVVADVRAPRDGKFIEKLGTFNPLLADDHDQKLVLNEERAKHWLGTGAKPTERLQKIFSKLGLTEAPEIREQPKKSAPKAKAQERMKEKAEKEAAAKEAAEEAAAEAAAAEAAPAEEAPAEEAPAEEAAAEEAPAEEAAAEEAPAEEEAKEEEKAS
ncbi:MAG: 30S ribosomal protein S16 [Alphaproteobacteria bacterium]|nr:30S ribosomal protein S16 [Alphaproteobacteria bacterium SS10]